MPEAFIIDAVRTPIGKMGGELAHIRSDALASIPLAHLIARNAVPANALNHVILGCASQIGEQGNNVARTASILAGLPVNTAGSTVHSGSGSGLQAVHFASMGVMSGIYNLVIAGGVESMSRISYGSDSKYQGTQIQPTPEQQWRFSDVPAHVSSALVAKKFGLRPDDMLAWAEESHRRAVAASQQGLFSQERIPMCIDALNGDQRFASDECIKEVPSINAPQADGSAGILIASQQAIDDLGLAPKVRIVAMQTSGVDPTMGYTGAIRATHLALEQAGLGIDDVDVIEIYEPFASVVLGCSSALGIPLENVNIHGGDLALGNPMGASGTRMLTTLVNVLEQKAGRFGLAAMSTEQGQGIGIIVDRNIYQ